MKAIINGILLLPDQMAENKVLLFDKKIERIVPKEVFFNNKQIHMGARNTMQYEELEIIDACGCYISPGWIDLHIHGAGGSDTMDAEPEALQVISKTIAKHGVTGFLPTTMTMSKDKIRKAFLTVKNTMKEDMDGAKILGVHMEGPFINERYKGAQNAEYVTKPDYEYITGYEDILRIITLAPEMDCEFAFIKQVRKHTNISLSIGHSDASYKEAEGAIKSGMNRITHLFNAMNSLHHRNPGIIGAAFNMEVYCELIADNIHVRPELYPMILRLKGKDNVILITDSIRAGGKKEAISELGGQKVIIKNNAARLSDGTLAGSILTLNQAIKNIYSSTHLELYEVIALASFNPAKSIGLEFRKGSLEVGKDADITMFDHHFCVTKTFVEGKNVYDADKNRKGSVMYENSESKRLPRNEQTGSSFDCFTD